MSIFDRLDRLTSRAIDRANARAFTFYPGRQAPNGRYGADPDRAEFAGSGILTDEEGGLTPIEQGDRDRSGNDLRSMVTGRRLELSVSLERTPEIKVARLGDRVTVEGDERIFDVVSVQRDGLSRLVLVLAA